MLTIEKLNSFGADTVKGIKKCGIIYLKNGSPRIAYHLSV